jgi:hypothetical protein
MLHMRLYSLPSDLGDHRLDDRYGRIRAQAATRPGASFPQMTETDADCKALYRFLANERVDPGDLLAPHIEATRRRISEHALVLVAHDTSEIAYGGEGRRSGLGLLPNGQGYLAHVALAILPGEERTPLGVIAADTIFREGKLGKSEARRRAADKESLRWYDVAHLAKERTGHTSLIHLADREADNYETLARLVLDSSRFVIRLKYDRQTKSGTGEQQSIFALLAGASTVMEREVKLTRRSKKRPLSMRRCHPPRQGRTARVVISAANVVLRCPRRCPQNLPATISLNVVHVYEPAPPPDEEGVEWYLHTTEPIDTVEEVAHVVDYYRARWTIEEFFKALKTGCALEKRQVECRRSFENAFALFIPIAWRLLLFRSLAHLPSPPPAEHVLDVTQRQVLEAVRGKPLPAAATAADALLAVAALGGHLKRNGEPGWQVIGRGYEKLLLLQQGWLAACGPAGCGQS